MEKKLSGWGNNKFANSKVYFPKNITEIKNLIKGKTIARGMGRSYGDSSIQPNSTIITKKLNKILHLDSIKGILSAEAGISVLEIIEKIIPHGWFLPVTPGSKFISLGGMIAADVHGKNHHKRGSFRNYIKELTIINEKKKLVKCSQKKNSSLFNYTIGGMGLTGIIYSCKFKLIKINSHLIEQKTIKSKNLKQTIQNIKKNYNYEYNVAWIDTSANKKNIGRSILFCGNHLKTKKNEIKKVTFKYNGLKMFNIFPNWILNSFTVKLLNILFYNLTSESKKQLSINDYFYQLDKIKNFNILYGGKGFISYQLAIPYKNSEKAITEILKILQINKIFSFVSVMKSLGRNDGFLSFGIKGFTLVFDFPIYKNIDDVLDKIDNIVIKFKGNIYLTKDSRIESNKFKKMQSGFKNKKFLEIRNKNKKIFQSLQAERLKI
ncbi:FAD-binding oxidoreductase [Candidatus Pelagibacter sp.]|jgi:decaprenylphospho-beta-D-ribofuranose 2-oxidase|nr:FAD-binding oxidoreductase [Candidatus Pelagibacter sp.]